MLILCRKTAFDDFTRQGGRVLQHGLPVLLTSGLLENPEFQMFFDRRKESGLGYLPQFSADLISWETPDTAPAVVADDGLIEACMMPFPDTLITGRKPRFFRLTVRDSALMK
ncbi:MAG: hypothetical protein EOP86_21050 [Verrucomicrobiaceae bacterium]|nr:MAG: hypothetical protein EOP86_21050 [Verrucomicrobiaceae bacterium]